MMEALLNSMKDRMKEGSTLRGILDVLAGVAGGTYLSDVMANQDAVVTVVDAAKDLPPEGILAAAGYLVLRGVLGIFTKEAPKA